MSPRRRNTGIALAALALIGLAVGAFFATHERVSEERPLPLGPEARANPLHALMLGLRGAGQTVVLKGHLALLREPPPPRGSVVLVYPEAQVETDTDAHALLDWVESGGRLVLPMPRGDAAPALRDLLIDTVGVEASRGAAAEADCGRLRLPGKGGVEEVCGTPFRLLEHAAPKAHWPADRQATRLARLAYGDGEMLVLSDLSLIDNGVMHRGWDDDRRESHTLQVAQLMAPLLDGEAVWLVVYRGGSLTALLAREGWPFFLGTGLALLAWLAWRSQRLGPIVPSAPAQRRALMEHIDAAGQFAFRNDHGQCLHAALREAVLERLSRRHALAQLDEASLAAALAERSRLSADALRLALALPPRATPEQYRDAIATLSTAFQRL